MRAVGVSSHSVLLVTFCCLADMQPLATFVGWIRSVKERLAVQGVVGFALSRVKGVFTTSTLAKPVYFAT